ncbi:PKD domain protein [anaerobic digester metagenome]
MIKGLLLCLFVGLLGLIACVGITHGEQLQVESILDVNIKLVSDNFTYDSASESFIGDVSSGCNLTTFTAKYISGIRPDKYNWILKNATTGVIIEEKTYLSPVDNYTHDFCQVGSYSLFVNASTIDGNFRVIPVGVRAVKPNTGYVGYSPLLFDFIEPYDPLFNPWEYVVYYFASPDSPKVDSYRFDFGDSVIIDSTDYQVRHQYPKILGKTYHGSVTAKNNTPMIYPDKKVKFDLTPIPPPTVDFNIYNVSSNQKITKAPVPVTIKLESVSTWPYYGINYPYYPDQTYFGWNWTTNIWDYFMINGYSDSHDIPGPIYPDTITYTKPGIYNITHYIADNFTDGTPGFYSNFYGNHTTKQLIVYDPIVPDFTYSVAESCAFPLIVTFKDNSKGSRIDKWLWDFDDGTTKITTVNTTEHTYHNAKTYQVNMTAYNTTYLISENYTKPVIAEGLFANFTYKPQVIETAKGSPVIVQFNSTSHGVDPRTLYEWEFEKKGQKYHNVTRNATMSYTDQGLFNVTLTVTKQSDDKCNGAKNTTKKQIRVNEFLEIRFSYQQIFSTNSYKVQFKDESTDTPTQRMWKFYHKNNVDYDTVLNDPNPQYTYPEKGQYRVELYVANDKGTGYSVEKWITVNENLKADFDPNITKGVSPLVVKFTDQSIPQEGINKWLWDFGDGSTITTKNPEHKFTLPAGIAQKQFNVNLTVTNQSTGASNSIIKKIDVIQPLVADFTPKGKVPTDLAQGVQFYDQSTGNVTGFLWNFDDGSTNATKNPEHKFPNYGVYNVSLTVSNTYYGAGNTTRNIVNITDKSSPVIKDFSANTTTINPGSTVVFTPQVQGPDIRSYYWTFGDGQTSTLSQPSHRYELPGKYDVSLKITSDFGTDMKTKPGYIIVRGLIPSFTTVPAGFAVVNTPVTFIDTSKGVPVKWHWDFGDGTFDESDTKNSTTHRYTEAKVYSIVLTVTNWEGLIKTASLPMTIVNKTVPQDVNFDVPEQQYSGKAPLEVQFEDTTPAQYNVTSRLWEFGDGTNSFEQAPKHKYEKPGQYSVTLTVRNDAGTNEKRRVAYVVVI